MYCLSWINGNRRNRIEETSSGEKTGLISKIFGLNQSTIRTIKQNESKRRNSVTAGSLLSAKQVERVCNVLIAEMEKALILLIEDCPRKIFDRFKRNEDERSYSLYLFKRNWSSHRNMWSRLLRLGNRPKLKKMTYRIYNSKSKWKVCTRF